MIRNNCSDFVSNPGSPIHVLYAPKVDEYGNMSLVENGKENTDDFIQSFAESTDINLLSKRIAAGETELLYQRAGSYGDFTKVPKTYAEMLQLQMDSNRLFQSLPVDVREKFGQDPMRFFAAAGTEEWYQSIEPVLPDDVKACIFPVKEDVKVES